MLNHQQIIILYGPKYDQMYLCASYMKTYENHCVCIILTYEALMQEILIIIYLLHRKISDAGKMI